MAKSIVGIIYGTTVDSGLLPRRSFQKKIPQFLLSLPRCILVHRSVAKDSRLDVLIKVSCKNCNASEHIGQRGNKFFDFPLRQLNNVRMQSQCSARSMANNTRRDINTYICIRTCFFPSYTYAARPCPVSLLECCIKWTIQPAGRYGKVTEYSFNS